MAASRFYRMLGLSSLFSTLMLNATVTTAQGITVLHSFAGGSDGGDPMASLTLGKDGNFYGTTDGGTTSLGTAFKMTPSGTLTTLFSFDSIVGSGAKPTAPLVQGSDGNFYGTTSTGDSFEDTGGTAFEITPTGILTTLFSFVQYAAPTGAYPHGGLVQASDGKFYGTTVWTTYIGAGGDGDVFRLIPGAGNPVIPLHIFEGAGDGGYPETGLVQGGNCNLYGTTLGGIGPPVPATVFEITESGTLTTLTTLTSMNSGGPVQTDGALIQGSDGNFYGTLNSDGIFRITPSGSLTTVYTFGTVAGAGDTPAGSLLQDSAGNLYGVTLYTDLGRQGFGTVFKLSPTGTLTTLYTFTGGNDGGMPLAGLAFGNDGNLYGTTSSGGAYGYGTVFMLPLPAQTAPPSPAGLVAGADNAKATLCWNASAGVTSYNVYEGTSSGGESPTPVLTGISATNAIVGNLSNNTAYYFEVAAVGPGGTSTVSNEVKTTPFALPGQIADISAQPGQKQASLEWRASAGATSYMILRSTVPGAEKPVAEGVTTTRYTATHLSSGTTYYFKVAGVNASGIGPSSLEVSVTPQ